MLTILPNPCASIEGRTAFATIQAALRSTSRQRSQSASVNSNGAENTLTPALLTRISIRPKRSSVVATAPATCSDCVTSQIRFNTPSATAPAGCRSSPTTRAPSEPNSAATAAPMPRAEPVTIATLLRNRPVMRDSCIRHQKSLKRAVYVTDSQQIDHSDIGAVNHYFCEQLPALIRGPCTLAMHSKLDCPSGCGI